MFPFYNALCFIVSQSDYYATGHKAKDLHNFVMTRKKRTHPAMFCWLNSFKSYKKHFILNLTCNLKTVISMFQSTTEVGGETTMLSVHNIPSVAFSRSWVVLQLSVSQRTFSKIKTIMSPYVWDTMKRVLSIGLLLPTPSCQTHCKERVGCLRACMDNMMSSPLPMLQQERFVLWRQPTCDTFSSDLQLPTLQA